MTAERENLSAGHEPGEARPSAELPWERVADELRAYREEQRRAWGDMDSTTLGRYLAGEVDASERQRIESALEELPELRKLTDLVRGVLEDFEPVQPPVRVVTPAPEPVPMPQRRKSVWLHYSSLAVAACLLFSLGVLLPYSRMFSDALDLPASAPAVASREPVAMLVQKEELEAKKASVLREDGERALLEQKDQAKMAARAGLDEKATAVEHEERPVTAALRMSSAVARKESPDSPIPPLVKALRDLGHQPPDPRNKGTMLRTVVALNRQAEKLQGTGDLKRAATAYGCALELSQKAFGPVHAETQRSRRNLARVYQTALNSPSPSPYNGSYSPPYQVEPAVPAPGGLGAAQPGTLAPEGVTTARAVPAPPTQVHQTLMPYRPLQDDLLERNAAELKSEVVPVLVDTLKTAPTPAERSGLALALGQLGPASRDAVPVLVETLQTRARDPQEQQVYFRALGQIGPGAKKALPVLITTVCNESSPTRKAAAEALVQMGPAARSAVPELVRSAPRDPLVRDVVRRLRGREGRIGICDECDCFGVQTLMKSRKAIRALAQERDLEALVETVPSVASLPPAQKGGDLLGSQGVHVIIGKEDRVVRVQVALPLRQQGLTAAELARAFAGPLARKDFDASLRAGIAFLGRFEQHQPPRR